MIVIKIHQDLINRIDQISPASLGTQFVGKKYPRDDAEE